MKRLLMMLAAVLCMALPPLSQAEMQQREPGQLAAAWQDVKKQISGDGQTIRVRDGARALELLGELGVVSVPEDGVKLSRGTLTIIVTRGKKEDGVFYVLTVTEEDRTRREVRLVPSS
ncbi:hypothetical protein [Akkermansia muciniphila]|uniref:hypothetical protein n=1 Tax=Akkermansia muciniphila TaxID=239935 RepID=UPI001BFF81E5|nr:hypothetical protein [Akkermansia muciniphila]MBT8779054.1 hypothetical protein [Akkermansia muciniphila]